MTTAYKFRVYTRPPTFRELDALRHDPSLTAEERDFYQKELSREELGKMVPGMVGRLVLFNHIADAPGMESRSPEELAALGENRVQREALGYVAKAEQDPIDGSIYVYLVLFDNIEGRLAFNQHLRRVEQGTGGAGGISLHHTRTGAVSRTREVSICYKGLRPETVYIETVRLASVPPPPSNRVYPRDHGDRYLPAADSSDLYRSSVSCRASRHQQPQADYFILQFSSRRQPTPSVVCMASQPGSLASSSSISLVVPSRWKTSSVAVASAVATPAAYSSSASAQLGAKSPLLVSSPTASLLSPPANLPASMLTTQVQPKPQPAAVAAARLASALTGATIEAARSNNGLMMPPPAQATAPAAAAPAAAAPAAPVGVAASTEPAAAATAPEAAVPVQEAAVPASAETASTEPVAAETEEVAAPAEMEVDTDMTREASMRAALAKVSASTDALKSGGLSPAALSHLASLVEGINSFTVHTEDLSDEVETCRQATAETAAKSLKAQEELRSIKATFEAEQERRNLSVMDNLRTIVTANGFQDAECAELAEQCKQFGQKASSQDFNSFGRAFGPWLEQASLIARERTLRQRVAQQEQQEQLQQQQLQQQPAAPVVQQASASGASTFKVRQPSMFPSVQPMKRYAPATQAKVQALLETHAATQRSVQASAYGMPPAATTSPAAATPVVPQVQMASVKTESATMQARMDRVAQLKLELMRSEAELGLRSMDDATHSQQASASLGKPTNPESHPAKRQRRSFGKSFLREEVEARSLTHKNRYL